MSIPTLEADPARAPLVSPGALSQRPLAVAPPSRSPELLEDIRRLLSLPRSTSAPVPSEGAKDPPSGDLGAPPDGSPRRSQVVLFLYRLTVHPSRQQSLFAGKLPPKPALLLQAVEAVSGKPPNANDRWALRNAQRIDDVSFHFKFGREGRRRIPAVRAGQFVDQDTDWAPHTDVLIDTALELCAISPNYDLAPTPDRLAGFLAQLLSHSTVAKHYTVDFKAAPIKEPREFFQQLSEAYAVKSLWVTTLRPNPSDLDTDFVEPVAQHIERLHANKARTTFYGDAIEANESTKKMIASTAAHGGDAGANVKDGPKTRSRPIKLTANATITVHRDALDKARDGVIEALRTAYEWILTRLP